MPYRPDGVFVQNPALVVLFLFICLSRMTFCCVFIRFWVKAFSLCRILAGPLIWDGGFPCDHKACSVEQWPSACQNAVLWSRSLWLSLLEWVGWFTPSPMCTVKYESYLAWFFYLRAIRVARRRKQKDKSKEAGLAGVKTSALWGSIRDDR